MSTMYQVLYGQLRDMTERFIRTLEQWRKELVEEATLAILQRLHDSGIPITDTSTAVEARGKPPVMTATVEGEPSPSTSSLSSVTVDAPSRILTNAGFAGEITCPHCGVKRQPFTLVCGPLPQKPMPKEMIVDEVGINFFCSTPGCGTEFKARLLVGSPHSHIFKDTKKELNE